METKKELALVYMVAGMSSRFGGKIKQFAKVGKDGETLIECSMQQALEAGFTKIIFIVGELTALPFKEKFGDNFNGIPIFYAFQRFDKETRDKPWGSLDAVCSAKEFLDCPFVVCNGDDLYGAESFKKLAEHLRESNEEASLGYIMKDTIPEKGSVNRAIFEVKDDYILGIEENYSITKENMSERENSPVSMNFFALHPNTLGFLKDKLDQFKEINKLDRKVESLLPNTLAQLIKEGKIKMRIYSAEDKWLGVTNPEDEEIVREIIGKDM